MRLESLLDRQTCGQTELKGKTVGQMDKRTDGQKGVRMRHRNLPSIISHLISSEGSDCIFLPVSSFLIEVGHKTGGNCVELFCVCDHVKMMITFAK